MWSLTRVQKHKDLTITAITHKLHLALRSHIMKTLNLNQNSLKPNSKLANIQLVHMWSLTRVQKHKDLTKQLSLTNCTLHKDLTL